ncbi:MAG TPA: chemotaxis protein CheW, partial [Sphingopyxis sp.]|uniref:chemotaxis protein CheA n=1 Tax=Sphingopyxis sp. TaxID=1908224 RepID=UPI002C8E1EC2
VQARLEQVTARLHRDVSSVRAVPLESALRRLPRLAREIAGSLGKQVAFSVEGADIEVDKQIADTLFEPLLHLLRNAIDHGTEAAADREAAGKPAEARIMLRFRRSGDSIIAELSDDGRGIDPAAMRRLAAERGLIDVEEAAAMSDVAAQRLIFAAGFSTAREVTSISGRGVGMGAVQAVVERLRGTIDLESDPGGGTRFTLRLPVSALTTRLLVVETGRERYGVALDQVIETVRASRDELKPVASGHACVLRGRTVPVVSLGALLGAGESDDPVARLLVTQAGGERVALRVEGFAERLDAFVRPTAGLLAAVPGVTGSTLMGDGSVLLVLDLPELLA